MHLLIECGLIGGTGVLVIDVGEPFHFWWHVAELLKLSGGEFACILADELGHLGLFHCLRLCIIKYIIVHNKQCKFLQIINYPQTTSQHYQGLYRVLAARLSRE